MPRASGKHVALMLVVAAAVAAGAAGTVLAVASRVPSRASSRAVSATPNTSLFTSRPAPAPLILAGRPQEDYPAVHSFYFTRLAYSGWRGWWSRRGTWAIDYPKADRQFLVVLQRLIGIDVYPTDHALELDDPAIRGFPFLYALEVGGMDLTEPEVRNLRDYLLAGGFLVIDDFWGTREWAVFEHNIRRVLPGYEIVDLPMDHPIFTTFYEIDEVLQVPSINNLRCCARTDENGGVVPYVKGILDDKDRLMVLINFNTDLGDAWEWAEQPDYPLKYSTYAFQMGVNFIVYAMSH